MKIESWLTLGKTPRTPFWKTSLVSGHLIIQNDSYFKMCLESDNYDMIYKVLGNYKILHQPPFAQPLRLNDKTQCNNQYIFFTLQFLFSFSQKLEKCNFFLLFQCFFTLKKQIFGNLPYVMSQKALTPESAPPTGTASFMFASKYVNDPTKQHSAKTQYRCKRLQTEG